MKLTALLNLAAYYAIDGLSGVSLHLCNVTRDKPIRIGCDGYIGSDFNRYDDILVQVTVDTGKRVYGFLIDGNKNCTPMRNRADGDFYIQGTRMYEKHIKVKKDDSGCVYTGFPDNKVRLLVMADDGSPERVLTGQMRIIDLSVVGHNGKLFVVVQETYRFECFRDKDGALCCPRFQRMSGLPKPWPQLVKLIDEILGTEKLPVKEPYQYDPPEPSIEGLKPGQGRIQWYEFAESFGLAEYNHDGRLVVSRVFRDHIFRKTEHGLPYLEGGDVVCANIREIPREPEPSEQDEQDDAKDERRARRTTTFKHELCDVWLPTA